MGDIADMMLDGTLCEGCGVYMDDSLGEFPQRCAACQESDRLQEITVGALQLAAETRVTCRQCGKRVKHAGIKDHIRDKHGAAPGKPVSQEQK